MEEAKRKRYDRQLRIWGEHGCVRGTRPPAFLEPTMSLFSREIADFGVPNLDDDPRHLVTDARDLPSLLARARRQARLEECKVCLLNCGPTGTETIKNLVLGGIASFTLVDDAIVEARDLGNNFFVHASDLGQSKAKAVAAHLNELNTSVAGSFVDERPEDLVASNPDFFADFTVVVATQMPRASLVALDAACRERGVILVALHARGLSGIVRLSLAEHTVVEAKPEETDFDLRVAAPWPELDAWANAFNLDALDDVAHKHVPHVVILLRALRSWRAAHGGRVPENAAEQREFKAFVTSGGRRSDEDNFREAAAAARHAWKPPGAVPAAVRDVLADSALETLAAPETLDFWFLVAGLAGFLAEGGGAMPLEGSLPDMTSTTESYVALQKLYQAKASADADAVAAHVRAALRAAGRPESSISLADVRHFCKHAAHIRVVRWLTLAEEDAWGGGCGAELARNLASEDTRACATLYVLHRAADVFRERYGRLPGTPLDGSDLSTDLAEDVAKLKDVAAGVLAEVGVPGSVGELDDLVVEHVRCGGGEVHAVAIVVGGIGSQEVIKLVTRQFTPCAKTLVYDAAKAVTASIM